MPAPLPWVLRWPGGGPVYQDAKHLRHTCVIPEVLGSAFLKQPGGQASLKSPTGTIFLEGHLRKTTALGNNAPGCQVYGADGCSPTAEAQHAPQERPEGPVSLRQAEGLSSG